MVYDIDSTWQVTVVVYHTKDLFVLKFYIAQHLKTHKNIAFYIVLFYESNSFFIVCYITFKPLKCKGSIHYFTIDPLIALDK